MPKKKAGKWRAVLVGCGGMSRAWVDAVETIPNLQLVGLVDIYPAAAEKLAQERKLKKVVIGNDLDEILAKTEANVLFVCSVPEAHKSNILSGLKNGCHVLTEKPLASTMKEARTVITAAAKARRTVAVTQNYRYRRPVRTLQKFLQTGKLGRLTELHADFHIGAHFGGFRDKMEHVLLLDMGIHTFDLARLFTGGRAKYVTAHEWNPANSWYRHGASAAALFEFTDRTIFNYRGSWCSQGFDTDWNAEWHIFGEKGSVRWDGLEKIEAEVVTEKTGFVWPKKKLEIPLLPEKLFPTPHTALIRNFIQCLDRGTKPETVITDNIHSLAMVHSAIKSAQEKRRVSI